jgi:hypothetical protein
MSAAAQTSTWQSIIKFSVDSKTATTSFCQRSFPVVFVALQIHLYSSLVQAAFLLLLFLVSIFGA